MKNADSRLHFYSVMYSVITGWLHRAVAQSNYPVMHSDTNVLVNYCSLYSIHHQRQDSERQVKTPCMHKQCV